MSWGVKKRHYWCLFFVFVTRFAMTITGRVSILKYRTNTVVRSVFVVDFKYFHVNALFLMVWAVECLKVKISTSSASNRGSRGGTIVLVLLIPTYANNYVT